MHEVYCLALSPYSHYSKFAINANSTCGSYKVFTTKDPEITLGCS